MEDAVIDKLLVARAMPGLNTEQIYVIKGLFWHGCSRAELAAELTWATGIVYDEERIKTIRKRALQKMRRHLEDVGQAVAA